MILKKIVVENFRNIKYAELEFSDNVNIFYGNNAQGKTNLLEAIAIALGKSFRNIRKNDITPFNYTNSKTKINLFYESEALPGKINEISYQPDIVKINSIPLKKAADLYGEFKYIVFIPDNLSLIKGYPDTRRYYLDNIAVMQNKVHRKFLNEYKEALKQRCAAYLSKHYFSEKDEMMQIWDDILIRHGINLTYGRLKYLNLIKNYAVEIYSRLSGGEKLDLYYSSDIFGKQEYVPEVSFIDFSNKADMYNVYKNKLSVNYEGISNKTPGAHKDDILFTINNNNARSYGSQGQLRSIAVSLKLAEAEIVRNFNRENSVVLLDDVLGELDEPRRRFIINQFVKSQVFITSCNINDFKNIKNIKIWSVQNGEFTLSPFR